MSHPSATGHSLDPRDLTCAVDRTLLAYYDPAAIVVAANFSVVETRGDLKRFGFAPSLTRVPRGPLGMAIRRLVSAGVAAEETVDGACVTILPLADTPAKMFCVLLQLSGENAAIRVRDLESRLTDARQYLATVLDDYSATTEELRSAYEELKAANEELHHLNDELTTSNQDLSSLNKLVEGRSRELHRVNAELSNVLSSVGIPMVLLDMDLQIRLLHPAGGPALPPHPHESRPVSREGDRDRGLGGDRRDLPSGARDLRTCFAPYRGARASLFSHRPPVSHRR
jgi:hypothetical protein